MTIWLLDDGPLGVLAVGSSSAWAWPSGTLHVVDEVARAAGKDKSGRRRPLLEMKDGSEPAIVVHKLRAEDEAGRFLFQHLRRAEDTTTKNLAEHASIALAATHLKESVFVTMDKGAAYLALAELGVGRVATPFDCWPDSRDSSRISG